MDISRLSLHVLVGQGEKRSAIQGPNKPTAKRGHNDRQTMAAGNGHVREWANGGDPFPHTPAVWCKGEIVTHYALLFHRPRTCAGYTRFCSSRSLHLD